MCFELGTTLTSNFKGAWKSYHEDLEQYCAGRHQSLHEDHFATKCTLSGMT